MPWARVDDGWWCHPKVIALDLDARGLWVSALSWSCQQKTDRIPKPIVTMCGDDGTAAAKLVAAGLWLEHDDGWTIHDWDDYQSDRAKKAAAGREGGRASGEARSRASREAHSDASSEAQPHGSAEAGPSHPIPTRPKEQERTSSRKRADRATRLPDGWQPTHEPDLVNAIGGQHAAQRELAKFVDYWAGVSGQKGRKVDWQATWRNWLRRASEDRQPKSRDGPAGRRPAVVGSDDWDRQRADQEALERRLLGDTA